MQGEAWGGGPKSEAMTDLERMGGGTRQHPLPSENGE